MRISFADNSVYKELVQAFESAKSQVKAQRIDNRNRMVRDLEQFLNVQLATGATRPKDSAIQGRRITE